MADEVEERDAPAQADLDEVAALVVGDVDGWSAHPVDAETAAGLAAGLADDLGIADAVEAVGGRLLLPAEDGPPVVALVLVVDPDGGAAQQAADRSEAVSPTEELAGLPWYGAEDDGAHSLVLCTPGFVLYLVGDDPVALRDLAGAFADRWHTP